MRQERRQLSTKISPQVYERARATVREMQKIVGAEYTLARFVEDALLAEAARLERRFNDGTPFRVTGQPLRPGNRLARTGEEQ